MNPWLGIAFVLVMLAALMTGLRWYKHRYAPHPELVRKLLHINMGLTTLTFPWLFDRVWPVLVLVGITVPGLLALRRSERLQDRLGGVIDGVKRDESLGEVYFPLGVAGLFILSGGDPLCYTIPLLLLALADAVAALIGVRYGRIHYTTSDGYKSAEGSLAFFGVAFFSAWMTLLFGGNVAPGQALLIALILGLLMMLVEAVAWQGLDNFLIPIVGFLLLNTFLEMTVSELAGRLMLTVALVLFVMLWRKRANLHDSALLGAALVGYLSWTLADWRWFLGPFIVFIGHVVLSSGVSWYTFFNPQLANGDGLSDIPTYNIHAVISVASSGLLWLLLFRALNRPELFYPFTLAFAAQFALLVIVARKHNGRQESALSVLLAGTIWGWLLLFIPFVLVEGVVVDAASKYALLAFVGVGLAAFTFYRIQPVLNHYPTDHARWLRQAGCAALGSVVGLVPLYLI